MKFVVAVASLRNQWKLTGNCQMIPLGKGFFIIKLDNEIGMRYVWNGYWMVETQALKLREWEPTFNPAAQKVTTTFVWIHFPGLGMEYWKEKIIMDLGERFGRAIKVDETTLKREVWYYASVLVEVDLLRYIPNQIVVKTKYWSFTQEVQIPQVPKFCSHCKVVGHLASECRTNNDNFKFGREQTRKEIKQWRPKEKSKTGFDICFTNEEKAMEQQVYDLLVSEDEVIDDVVPPLLYTEEKLDSIMDKQFTLDIQKDFPLLSAEKLLNVASVTFQMPSKTTENVSSGSI
ncbi:uncharacterized protein LOC113294632 [Papaver somniferum]|uniref:uncharacterized protein LOC113294632 n=1 Tax=Papaver somniferum TaxID=3469 RepID=UPI000E6F8AFB|nr:uncharacterized protein LOC113294632 [Papaver somniferum]